MGQLRRSFTVENSLASGVALSRDRAHHVRLTCNRISKQRFKGVMVAYRQERADQARRQREEDDEQKSKSGGSTVCCLRVDFRKRETALRAENGVKICDAVQNGNGEAEGVNRSQTQLGGDGSWDVSSWVG